MINKLSGVIITKDNKKDFLDYMMPKITIHERLEMLKIILLPLMHFVKFFCIQFIKHKED